jgi:hypothetical protein
VRRRKITSKLFDLKDNKERLYSALDDVSDPKQAISDYNKRVNEVLDNDLVSGEMYESWSNLVIDVDTYIKNKVVKAGSATDLEGAAKAKKVLKNFGITAEEARKIKLDDRFGPKKKRERRDPREKGLPGLHRQLERIEKGLK